MASLIVAHLMHHEKQHIALFDGCQMELVYYYHVHAPDRFTNIVFVIGIFQSER